MADLMIKPIFSTEKITDSVADLYFYDSQNTPYCFYANNGSGGIHDMGAVQLEDVITAPGLSNGVGIEKFYNDQDTTVIKGHTYCVVTKDGRHYAKIQITGMGSR
ncbi:MAG: hypothetical protein GY737_14325 [Desulfobacteraceae bacterium]|nr:hypothetical protein [Desulfobacteraceae bacterium]